MAFRMPLPLAVTTNQITGATEKSAMSVKLGVIEASRKAFTATATP